MASENAADESPMSPDLTKVTEPGPVPGKIESAVLPKDQPVPDNLDRIEEKTIFSRHKGNADTIAPDEEEEEAPPDDDDLFGEGDDEELREEAEELSEPYVSRKWTRSVFILMDITGEKDS